MLNASAIRNGHGTAHEIQHTQCNPLEPDEQCYKSSMAFLVEQNSKNWVESFEWANVSLNRCSFSNIFDQSISAFEHFSFFILFFSFLFFLQIDAFLSVDFQSNPPRIIAFALLCLLDFRPKFVYPSNFGKDGKNSLVKVLSV